MNLFPHRIDRLAYLLRFILLFACAGCNLVLLSVAAQISSLALQIPLYIATVIIGLAILIVAFRALLCPRVRDIALTNAYALLIFVPLVNAVLFIGLFFVPSDAFNKSLESA